jgi:hypothetical protein
MTHEELVEKVAEAMAPELFDGAPNVEDFRYDVRREARAAIAIVLEEAAKEAAVTCVECGGAEWLWAHEISAVGSQTDDTKYSCRNSDYRETCKAVAAIRALGKGDSDD